MTVDQNSPIKDVLQVKEFLVAMGKAAKDVMADGKVDAMDLTHLVPVLMQIPDVVKAIPNVGAELKLLPEHIEELTAGILMDLGVVDPKVAVYVEEGVKLIQSAYKIFKTVQGA